MPRTTLTRKQAHFVELYLAEGNAAEAYRQAYSSAAPSRSVAREGHRLLKHPKIAPFLAEAEVRARAVLVEAANRYAVSRERNVAELARMAYANLEDFTRQVGKERVIDLSGATRDQLAALQEITVEDYLDGRGKDARQVRRTKIKLGRLSRTCAGDADMLAASSRWGDAAVPRKKQRSKPIHQMTIRDFERMFPDDDACKLYLAE